MLTVEALKELDAVELSQNRRLHKAVYFRFVTHAFQPFNFQPPTPEGRPGSRGSRPFRDLPPDAACSSNFHKLGVVR